MSLRTITLLGIAVLALAAPASALATQTYSDTISGYEYYATSTDGKFAGTASGALPGDWNADGCADILLYKSRGVPVGA